MSGFSIFDPRKVPATDSPSLPQYDEHEIATLLPHYGAAKFAETLLGESTSKKAIITSGTDTEWKTYRQKLVDKPESSTKITVRELVSKEVMKTLFPT